MFLLSEQGFSPLPGIYNPFLEEPYLSQEKYNNFRHDKSSGNLILDCGPIQPTPKNFILMIPTNSLFVKHYFAK
ncbi:MAG: hypothetical protein AMJ73_05530 [candidate division Zixibacteria bacterium SM1_73]|nr:MAG: hypothetical protein AMJ73_05530 [candidate division Zixibacteria bacterium SM1_73]